MRFIWLVLLSSCAVRCRLPLFSSSTYSLHELRARSGFSQFSLAAAADVDGKAPGYFESHPAEPLASRRHRKQLVKICRVLAERLDEDREVILGRASVLGGGINGGET